MLYRLKSPFKIAQKFTLSVLILYSNVCISLWEKKHVPNLKKPIWLVKHEDL